ncbi:MAG TPA: ATP-binding protein [Gemmatimonadaceae bacterium]|nr:ATP-binding protein [Gemmatimonadaceae bacterium]
MPASDRFRYSASSPPFDPEGALDAIDEPLCVVSTAWRLLYMNQAFAELAMQGSDIALNRDVRDIFTSLADRPDTNLAAMTPDERRLWRLSAFGKPPRTIDVRATRLRPEGVLLHFRILGDSFAIERALAERDEENAAMREVVNALAREADLDPLLRVICEQAASQCDASGATVVRLQGDRGHIVSATGSLEAMRGTRFPLAGSLTARAFEERRPVRAQDYRVEHPRFLRTAEEFEVGPALFAPLIAHDQMLGALTVARRRGAAVFTAREERRISAIADYAALALWKAHLTEEARSANRIKGEFIATMSHELRTPLTALLGYEELFAEHIFGPLTEQQEAAVDRMRVSTQHLQAIIDEVLTFSRLEAGEERAHVREVLVREVFHGAMAVLEPLAHAKRIAISTSIPEEPRSIRTDPEMLRRILINLGGNAIKFTERGSVTLSATMNGDCLVFSVTDTGIGIAREDIARLFQPFTQLDSGFTRRFGGTGLGLFVSRRLAELLGGSIKVTSAPGSGSTFTVSFPVEG